MAKLVVCINFKYHELNAKPLFTFFVWNVYSGNNLRKLLRDCTLSCSIVLE